MRALLLTLLLTLAPGIALAEPTEPTPLVPVPSGPDNIVVLKKGEAAPFDGQLFDQPTAVRWANYLQQAHARLRLDPLYQYKIDQVEVQALRDELKTEKKKYDEVTADLNVKLAQAQAEKDNPPFYKTFWFGATIGVVTSVTLTVAVAAALGSSQ